jgi:hypothetical protein
MTLTLEERIKLPWYDDNRVPHFVGDSRRCRDPRCKDTNWGGYGRVHYRSDECPPYNGPVWDYKWHIYKDDSAGWTIHIPSLGVLAHGFASQAEALKYLCDQYKEMT